MTASSLGNAQAECLALARRHYENFPTASVLLPARVRPAIAAIYAFARTADDFADEPEHAGRREELLLDFRGRLERTLAGSPEGPVFEALAEAVRRHDLPHQPLFDLLDAFLQDVRVSRYRRFPEVLDYCTRSANPVGRLVLAVHGIRDRASVAASDAICTGLQLANFWQDVSVDLDKDRIYLPLDDLERFGLDEDDLFERWASPEFRQLLAFEVARTRAIFAEGHPLVASLRGRLGLWLRCVWAGGHRILDLIEREGHDVFRHRPRLRARDWLAIGPPALLGRVTPRPASPAGAIA